MGERQRRRGTNKDWHMAAKIKGKMGGRARGPALTVEGEVWQNHSEQVKSNSSGIKRIFQRS